MKSQKLLRLSVVALGLAFAFPVAAQQSGTTQNSSSTQQSAAGGQSAPEVERRDEGTNWGWLGLLGLIGLAGLRRRNDHRDRPYVGTRGAT